MNEMTIDLGGNVLAALPSFTSSHTLCVRERDQVWLPAAEIVQALGQAGVSVSKQTLFLHEQAGRLHTRRISARKIYFELNEAFEHFNAQQP